jgi:predicted nucleic acid-binding protein
MVVDASVWVSEALPTDANHDAAVAWFATLDENDPVAIPAIALAEVAGAIARRTGQAALGQAAAGRLTAFPGLLLVEMDRRLAERAALLAANHRLRGADALYVAAAAKLAMPLVTLDIEMASRAAAAVTVIRLQ